MLRSHRHLLLAASTLLAGHAAWGQTILSTLTLNGSAEKVEGKYILLTTTNSQAGSAFTPTPYTLGPNASFEVAFVYNAYSGGVPGDGLAFVAQNTPAGPTYLGTGGDGLGFFTLVPSNRAIAATFDYYKSDITNTPANTAAISLPVGTDLVSTQPALNVYGGGGMAGRRYVWVDYSNPTKAFLVYYSDTATKPAKPLLSTVLAQDLSSAFGEEVYFGFTGGTGAFSTEQGILYMHVAVINP